MKYKALHYFLTAFLSSSGLLGIPSAQQANNAQIQEADIMKIPLTVSRGGQTLKDVLHQLDPNEGPHLLAGGEAQRERLSIYAKNLPRVNLMNNLSHLLNYPWTKDTLHDPPQKYSLWRDNHTKDYEQELLRQTLERGAVPLFRLASYLKNPPEYFDHLSEAIKASGKQPDDPVLDYNLYYLQRPGPRSGLEMLSSLSRDQVDELLTEGQLVLNGNNMTDRQKQIAYGCGIDVGRLRAAIERALPGETIQDNATAAVNIGLILHADSDPVSGAIQFYGYGLGGGMMAAGVFLNMPDSQDILHVRGNPYRERPEDKLPVYPNLQRTPFPSDFDMKVAQFSPWRIVMKELSRHLSIPIFSDDYSFRPDPKERHGANLPDLTKLNLVDGLDALCNHYRYLWWYENGALFFRSRTWFIERQYEVPPPLLASLRKHLQDKGLFDAESLTLLSKLTYPQLQGLNASNVIDSTSSNLLLKDPRDIAAYERKGASIHAYDTFYYLQVYALLNDAEKEKVLSPDGLSVGEMSPDQMQAFAQALFFEDGPQGINALPHARMKASQHTEDGFLVWPDPDTPEDPGHQQRVRQVTIVFTYKDHDMVAARTSVYFEPKEPADNPQK